jgi:hypothetical protein
MSLFTCVYLILPLVYLPPSYNNYFLVGQNALELARVDEDPKERKRERERARFASMSEQEAP